MYLGIGLENSSNEIKIIIFMFQIFSKANESIKFIYTNYDNGDDISCFKLYNRPRNNSIYCFCQELFNILYIYFEG